MGRVGASLWGKGSFNKPASMRRFGGIQGMQQACCCSVAQLGSSQFYAAPLSPWGRHLENSQCGMMAWPWVVWCWWWRRRAVPSRLEGMTRARDHVVLKGARSASVLSGSATSLRHGQSCHRDDVGDASCHESDSSIPCRHVPPETRARCQQKEKMPSRSFVGGPSNFEQNMRQGATPAAHTSG